MRISIPTFALLGLAACSTTTIEDRTSGAAAETAQTRVTCDGQFSFQDHLDTKEDEQTFDLVLQPHVAAVLNAFTDVQTLESNAYRFSATSAVSGQTSSAAPEKYGFAAVVTNNTDEPLTYTMHVTRDQRVGPSFVLGCYPIVDKDTPSEIGAHAMCIDGTECRRSNGTSSTCNARVLQELSDSTNRAGFCK